VVDAPGTSALAEGCALVGVEVEERLMGALRKGATKRQGLFTKTYGNKQGMTIKGKVKTQDTGKRWGQR
jgi:hypothetical protein